MKRAVYDFNPEILEKNGDGSHTYRWDIQEVFVEEEVKWECNEIVVWETLTRDLLLQTAIRTVWNGDKEKKLINDYNASKEGMYGDENELPAKGFIDAYKAFLSDRMMLKSTIDNDCDTLGIV